jgi:hypothetical protein
MQKKKLCAIAGGRNMSSIETRERPQKICVIFSVTPLHAHTLAIYVTHCFDLCHFYFRCCTDLTLLIMGKLLKQFCECKIIIFKKYPKLFLLSVSMLVFSKRKNIFAQVLPQKINEAFNGCLTL